MSSPVSTKPRPATSTRVPPPRTPAGGDALDRRRRQVAERHAARREVGAAVRAHLERKRARAPASTSGASAPLAAALRRHRRRQELQREDNIKAFMSVVSTQAIGSSTATYARALARSLSSIVSPSTGRQAPSLFLYCALTTSENHTRRLQTPPLHLRLTITHPLVFAYFCFHPRSHSGSLALSHKEEAGMASKVTSQGSRATHNRSNVTELWVFRTEFCAEHRTNQVIFPR